jgi:UDP-N-acetylglucosamine 4,6-dehydratase/5-epimerase
MNNRSHSAKKNAKKPVLSPEDFAPLNGKVVLVTGATGSFGKRFVEKALKLSKVKKLIVFSRDELKQSEMAPQFKDARLRFFIGDVRDTQRLSRAFTGVDVVIHAAALKQVPTLEYNPFEAVQTNILGAENIINAAIDQNVKKVVALSTDKAVNPINLYGATKLCAEKLFVAGNSYAAGIDTRFSVVRYGNVVGSRGSVIPFFLEKRKEGVLPITDERMTRFWLTLDQGIALVLRALSEMKGGEIFIPKIPSMRITDLKKAIAPECKTRVVGIRPGEKLHEALLTEDEAARTVDLGDVYLVKPNFNNWSSDGWAGKPVADGFRYSSETNDWWLTADELRDMVDGKKSPETVAA